VQLSIFALTDLLITSMPADTVWLGLW